MTEQRVRENFEAFISAPPFERDLYRYDENGKWPGAYVDYHVHLAWDAWQAAWREGMSEAAGICLHVGRDLYESGGLGVDCSQKCAAAIRERMK